MFSLKELIDGDLNPHFSCRDITLLQWIAQSLTELGLLFYTSWGCHHRKPLCLQCSQFYICRLRCVWILIFEDFIPRTSFCPERSLVKVRSTVDSVSEKKIELGWKPMSVWCWGLMVTSFNWWILKKTVLRKSLVSYDQHLCHLSDVHFDFSFLMEYN